MLATKRLARDGTYTLRTKKPRFLQKRGTSPRATAGSRAMRVGWREDSKESECMVLSSTIIRSLYACCRENGTGDPYPEPFVLRAARSPCRSTNGSR